MKALVLCAGFGTRLGSLTAETPKPMLPIGGQPLLAYTIDHLAKEGISEIAINLHYRPETIRGFLGDGSERGVRIHYVEEESLLGTAGAVMNLAEFFHDDDFLVLYGDILTDQSLDEVFAQHRQTGALATLVLHQRVRSNSFVVMDEERRITQFHERPNQHPPLPDTPYWVNSGIQVLSPDILDYIPKGVASDLPKDVYVPLVESGDRLYGYPLSGYRCAIDSPERYREAVRAVESGEFGAPGRH